MRNSNSYPRHLIPEATRAKEASTGRYTVILPARISRRDCTIQVLQPAQAY